MPLPSFAAPLRTSRPSARVGRSTGPRAVPPPPAPITPAAPPGFRRDRRFRLQVLAAGDLAIGLGALGGALKLRDWTVAGHAPLHPATIWACGLLFLLALGIAALEHWHTGRALRAPGALRAVTGAALVTFSLLFGARGSGEATSRPTLFYFALLCGLGLALWHGAADGWLRRGERRRPLHLIMVGNPSQCRQLAVALSGAAGWRLRASLSDAVALRQPLEAGVQQLYRLLRASPVDAVLLTPTFFSSDPRLAAFYRAVIQVCEATGTRLHLDAAWLDTYARMDLDHLGSRPLLTFSFSPHGSWPLVAKRALDLVLGSVLLALSLPLLALSLLAIRLDSPGPLLFRQERCGQRGRRFTLYKLRSMVADAEAQRAALAARNEMRGPHFKILDDPRITRVGRWLRRSSLDELPQLFNVLCGDMSLVGPRPPLPAEVERYQLGDLRRLAVKPGLTGPWQVSGRNRVVDFQAWVELDAGYIRGWSLWRDLCILGRTLGVVLRMTGQ
ncbi:MAG: exopolysaccharide biosynthesis polyprenyl glycosylphosphotransferase [Terriglobales bacterium]